MTTLNGTQSAGYTVIKKYLLCPYSLAPHLRHHSMGKYGFYITNQGIAQTTKPMHPHNPQNKHQLEYKGSIWKSKILKLEQLITLKLCRLGHKISHFQLPTPIIKVFNHNGGKKIHRYPTRNRNTPNIQKHSITVFNKASSARA